MMDLLFSLQAVLLFSTSVAAGNWQHTWETTSEMTFADFNPSKVLTDSETTFAAEKYKILSLEKCTGIGGGVKTEDAIYTIAQNIKRKSPSTKVLFYWATDQQGIQCYNAGAAFDANPSWWMTLDNGTAVEPHVLNASNAEARAWWVSIPLKGDGNGTFKGVPVSQLIDGVLADSSSYGNYGRGHVSQDRLEAVDDAKKTMIGELQQAFTKANGGVVMGNGVSMYGPAAADPRHPQGHNLRILNFTTAIMNEHTAVFESVNSQNASFNMDTVSSNLDVIDTAAKMDGGSKLVFVQTWPGLYTNVHFYPEGNQPAHVYPPVANGGEPTPQNNSQWRAALREHFAFAHALFLTVADVNVYWMYAGVWYSGNTGYLPCPQDLNSCPAPPEWYPDLKKPLGPPLGPRTLVSPYKWTRKFQHATVTLDLYHPKQSKVVFDSDLN